MINNLVSLVYSAVLLIAKFCVEDSFSAIRPVTYLWFTETLRMPSELQSRSHRAPDDCS